MAAEGHLVLLIVHGAGVVLVGDSLATLPRACAPARFPSRTLGVHTIVREAAEVRRQRLTATARGEGLRRCCGCSCSNRGLRLLDHRFVADMFRLHEQVGEVLRLELDAVNEVEGRRNSATS